MSVALVLLLVGALLVGRFIAEHRALTEAEDRTSALARNTVAPLVDGALMDGVHPPSVTLRRLLIAQVQSGNAVHLKLWSQNHVVVWADEGDLVGKQFDAPPVTTAFDTGRPVSKVSDLNRRENAEERGEGRLLEVYAPDRGRDNTPFVLEVYQSTKELRQERRSIVLALLGLSAGVLFLFGAAMLPLGVGLARRVERGRREREGGLPGLGRHLARAPPGDRVPVPRAAGRP